MQKGQSSIEFLSTYGFAFLIIAIAIFLLLIFSSIPKASLPPSCAFYSGFNCIDSAYYNLGSGSQMIVYISDSQEGVMNISGFTAILGYSNSIAGTCVPNLISAGQKAYCTANFTSSATLGNLYTGTFLIKAKYCANGPSATTSLNCTGGPSYTFGGSMQTEAASFSSSFVSQFNPTSPLNIFCITGTTGYNAPISTSGGLGNWIATNAYPISLSTAGCSVFNSNIYCVGSNTGSGEQAYYAPVSTNGIGKWVATTSYPIALSEAGCSVYKGDIYCIGSSTGTEEQSYYAPLTTNTASANGIPVNGIGASGIGNWIATTSYPIALRNAGCSLYNGYAYCVGSGSGPSSSVYYAPIGSNGIGTWKATTNYPTTSFYDAGCSIYNGYIYCIGNGAGAESAVYYAPVSSGGIGNWISANAYPISMAGAGCSVFQGYMYCVGSSTGSGEQVYYAPILNPGLGAWTPASYQFPTSFSNAYCSVGGSSGGYLGGGGGPT